MKKTKQQIIDDLQSESEALKKTLKTAENLLYKIKVELWEEDSYKYNDADILREVMRINASSQSDRGYRNSELELLRAENNRFWLLIRSLSGDKTLEKELEMNSEEHIRFKNFPRI